MKSEKYANIKIGSKIGVYTIIGTLGQGSYGYVYKAFYENCIVAIKTILKQRYQECGGIVGKLIQNERNALMKLNSQNVIKCYEYFEEQDFGVFILEYCNNGTLEELWEKDQKNFPEVRTINYFKQIVKGMKALHQEKIIHRDLKMANILVHNDILKIADLGFCHQFNNYDSVQKLSLGSLGTKAPEIIEGKPYGISADMFSIGVILYQMLFGQYPFSAFTELTFMNDVIKKNPPKYNFSDLGSISKTLTNLLTQMLQKDPQNRLKWTELFSDSIFAGQSSLIRLKHKDEYVADIDPYESKLFYQMAQEPNFFNQDNQIQANQFLESKPILIQTPKSEEDTIQNLIKDVIAQKYPISWLSITYNQMHNDINHNQILMSVFPSYMLLKNIYYEHAELKQQIQSHQRYSDLLKMENFLNFMKEFEEEHELLNTHLMIEFQTVQANYQKLKKFLQQDQWELEIFQMNKTTNFSEIYQNCLKHYIADFYYEKVSKTKYNELDNKNLLVYILRLTYCVDYEKLKNNQQLDQKYQDMYQLKEDQLQNQINIWFIENQG